MNPPPYFTSQISTNSQHPKIQPLLKRTSQKTFINGSKNLQKYLKYNSKTSKTITNIPETLHLPYIQRVRDVMKIVKAQDSLSKFCYTIEDPQKAFQQESLRMNLKNLSLLPSLDLKIHHDSALKMLFKSLSALKNLTQFSLELRSLLFQDPKIIRLLFKKLRSLKKLTSLTISLRVCPSFRGPELEIFSSNLALLTQLRSLNLGFDSTIQFDDKSLIKLGSDLQKLTQLTQIQIDLGEGKRIEGPTLLRIFTSLGTLKTLSDINIELRSCQIVTENDREYLSESLLCLDIPSIRKLSLIFYKNFMKDSLVKISKALKKFPSLETLSLNFFGCSNITNEGMAELSSSLKKLTSLSSLSVNFPSSVNADFLVRDLASALKPLSKLVYLKLDLQRKDKTTADQVELLFRNLQTLSCLRFLDLNLGFYNCLSDAAMEILSESLKKLVFLQNLTLNFACTNVITSKGVEVLSNSIKGLRQLSLLNLNFSWNENFDERAANAIAEAMEDLPDLYSVSLYVNRCAKLIEKESGLASLFNVLSKKGNIRDVHLGLTQNEVNAKGIDELGKRKNISCNWL